MSLLQNHSLAQATAVLYGESATSDGISDFAVAGLRVARLLGLEAAPGHTAFDSDVTWKAVIRAWWGLGLTCGICVSDECEEIAWNLVLPAGPAGYAVTANLLGAQFDERGDFCRLASRLRKFPFRTAMAGHSAIGQSARLETTLRSMLGRQFMLIVLARAVPRSEIEGEIGRLAADEQFIRDEHLSRPSLERDNHTRAARFLSLVESARDRACAALQEGGWHVRTILAATNENDFQHAKSLIHSAFADEGGKPEPLRWQDLAAPRGVTFLRTEEFAAITRPPQRDLPGFSVEARIEPGQQGNSNARSPFATAIPARPDQPQVAVGRILADNAEAVGWLDLAISDLCRHLLVAGMTGSGKTTTCEHLLLELWREHRIPWLVIEPGMKNGYRRLLNSEIGADLNVWAIGAPGNRRIALNPMAAPAGIGVAEHTSGLFAVISSAFELVPPMPEVLATAIEQTYRNHGCDLQGVVPSGPSPQLSELIREIDRSTRTLGYGPEITANIRAGLLLRLKRLTTGPLAPELNAPAGLDMQTLINQPTIIELSALPDSDSQALIMGFLTLQLRHHWRLAGQYESLRHVTLLEEAHRLLRAVPETAANASRTRAVEDLANMLAELRAMGAGLIIVDQTPSALVPSAIANTGTKLLHRLDHPADRELAGRAAGLPADQVDLLGSLRTGDAILRTDRRPRPFRLRIPNPSLTYGKMPLPELWKSEASEECVNTPTEGTCFVCKSPGCVAEMEGKRPELLRNRLADLQAILGKGQDAVWSWASVQVEQADLHGSSSSAPLCFLIAAARAANLSESVVLHLVTIFQTQISRAS